MKKIKTGGWSCGPAGVVRHPVIEHEVPDNWFEDAIAALRAAPKMPVNEDGCYVVPVSAACAKAISGK